MQKSFVNSFLIPAAAANRPGQFHMMDWYAWGGWGMLMFPLFWILLIVTVIFFIARGFIKTNIPPQEKSKSALEILKERYAKGEIDKEKFEEMKKGIGPE